MAINAASVRFWRDLHAKGLLPRNPAVLEIGEANWWGDVPVVEAPEIAAGGGPGANGFDTAKAFYRALLGPETTFTAIDLHGTPQAHRLDLNRPQTEWLRGRRFGVLINSGTAEHVFDQGQVWRTMHLATAPGGLMVHEAPMSGWPDHGFYGYHPTFFRDLAAANGYTALAEMVYRIEDGGARPPHLAAVPWAPPADYGLLVALRKGENAPFVVPRQGRYAEGG